MESANEGSYCIAHLMQTFSPEGAKSIKVTLNHKLSSEEHNAYKECFKDIAFHDQGLGLYFSVQHNMEDLLRAIVEFGRRYLDAGHMTSENMNASSISFARLILNLTSMFRSFLDHGNAAITRRYGAKSTELAEWKSKQSEQFDKSRAYRFMSQLRNYCQHVGMPPLNFSISQSLDKEGASIEMNFPRDELLSTYGNWQHHVKSDLKNGPEHLPLLTYLQDWSICFHSLADWIITLRRNAAYESAEMILNVRKKYGIDSEGVIAIAKEPEAGEMLSLSLQNFPEDKALDIVQGKPILSVGDSLELDPEVSNNQTIK